MKYLLLIRDIKDAPRSYTHLIQWKYTEIFNQYCEIYFHTIRYYETNELQIVMLDCKNNAKTNEFEEYLYDVEHFKNYLFFDDDNLTKKVTYGECIAELLHLDYNEKFEKLSKPIKE